MKKLTRKNTNIAGIELADVGMEQTAVAVATLVSAADQLEAAGHQLAAGLIRQLGFAVVQIEQGRKR